jgi:predicted Zn-dependent peptidase
MRTDTAHARVGIAALALGGAVCLGAAILPATAGVPPGFVSEVLANGLRVSILADPDTTIVATELWYHVGSANEDPDNRGFAHLFEHLMFGRTENHDKEVYANHHHRHGGYENAYTSFDETVYVSHIPPEHHARVLELEADRMIHLVLDQDALDNEKRIVSEELRLGMENDPFSRVGVATLKAVFGSHPYAHTPGGTREDVGAATLDHCREFYDSYYRPGNAHLVIVGPFDAEEKLAEVRRAFDALPAGGVTPPDVPAILGWGFPEEVVLQEDLPPAEVALLGYPMPPPDGDDYWAIALMNQLLGGGEVDPFEESMVSRKKRAVYAGTEWMSTRRGMAVMFTGAFLPYRTKAKAFRLMEQGLDELEDLEWLTDESLASAKRTMLRRLMNSAYYPASRADDIGRAEWWRGDARLAFEGPERIESVTRDQVAAAFHEYVRDAKPVRVYLRPNRVPIVVRLFGWLYPLFQG